MAMTPLEKKARKAAQKVRDKAFNDRCKARRDAERQLQGELDKTPERRALDEAFDAREALINQRGQAVKCLRQ